jgi:hypothetical protein
LAHLSSAGGAGPPSLLGRPEGAAVWAGPAATEESKARAGGSPLPRLRRPSHMRMPTSFRARARRARAGSPLARAGCHARAPALSIPRATSALSSASRRHGRVRIHLHVLGLALAHAHTFSHTRGPTPQHGPTVTRIGCVGLRGPARSPAVSLRRIERTSQKPGVGLRGLLRSPA